MNDKILDTNGVSERWDLDTFVYITVVAAIIAIVIVIVVINYEWLLYWTFN